MTIGWTRRARNGFGWVDGIDAPLDEQTEGYRLTLSAGSVSETYDVDAPFLELTSATVSQWRARGAGLAFSIRQIGANGLSPALESSLTL